MATKKKGRQKKKNLYWTQDTEQGVIDYNSSTDPSERDRIFRDKLHKPIIKLIECVVNRFSWTYIHENKKDIQAELLSFILSVIHKFKNEKGRAFSYFSIVVKNYMILDNRARFEHTKSHIPIMASPGDDTSDRGKIRTNFDIADPSVEQGSHADEMSEFNQLLCRWWDHNLTLLFTKPREIAIADAIVELFRRGENLENFSKKYLYILIRDMTGYKTTQITTVATKMKPYFKKLLMEYIETGGIDMRIELK